MAWPDGMNSQYKGVQCHECEGYDHIRPECATFLKKQKKSLTASWSEDDKSDLNGEGESANHIAALSSTNFCYIKPYKEDLGYDDLAMFHKNPSDRNIDTCLQLE